MDYEGRRGRNSKYKINDDLIYFYGRMHIEGFLDWIAQIENFFEHKEIPQEK